MPYETHHSPTARKALLIATFVALALIVWLGWYVVTTPQEPLGPGVEPPSPVSEPAPR